MSKTKITLTDFVAISSFIKKAEKETVINIELAEELRDFLNWLSEQDN